VLPDSSDDEDMLDRIEDLIDNQPNVLQRAKDYYGYGLSADEEDNDTGN
jgi:hypothetical protein